jgi:hypothetical protein
MSYEFSSCYVRQIPRSLGEKSERHEARAIFSLHRKIHSSRMETSDKKPALETGIADGTNIINPPQANISRSVPTFHVTFPNNGRALAAWRDFNDQLSMGASRAVRLTSVQRAPVSFWHERFLGARENAPQKLHVPPLLIRPDSGAWQRIVTFLEVGLSSLL